MKKIVFTGGGTAGHVMPNLALISALRGEFDCVYIGGDGAEKDLCASRGIPFCRVDTVKFRRDAIFANFSIPFKLRACVCSARKILDELKPDLIFSKGGYVSLPAVLAAKRCGVPLVCHESDLSPGIVTKLSENRAEKILCAFEDTATLFKNGVYVGTPLGKALFDPNAKTRGAKLFGTSGKKPVLLIMGGSSGAATLNEITVRALPELTRVFDVIHLTGKSKSGASGNIDGYTKLDFCNDMPALYATVDLAISRAGANSLAELAATGTPAVAVPLEKASRGDQIENADYYEKRGAVKVLRERDMTEKTLLETTLCVYNSRAAYTAAARRLKIDGTEKICSIIKEEINRK